MKKATLFDHFLDSLTTFVGLKSPAKCVFEGKDNLYRLSVKIYGVEVELFCDILTETGEYLHFCICLFSDKVFRA